MEDFQDRAALALRQWRAELPGQDLLPMAVLGRLSEATQLIARGHTDPVFAGFGLQAGEFDVLATLRRSGAPYTLSPTALYGATMISSGGMTNRLDRLEKAGLIERKPNPDDRRSMLVALSEAGLRLINDAVLSHIENQHRILSGLTRQEQEDLARLLGKVIESVRDPVEGLDEGKG